MGGVKKNVSSTHAIKRMGDEEYSSQPSSTTMDNHNNKIAAKNKPGILRLDINKPRRSSGGSVEFRSQPELLGGGGEVSLRVRELK